MYPCLIGVWSGWRFCYRPHFLTKFTSLALSLFSLQTPKLVLAGLNLRRASRHLHLLHPQPLPLSRSFSLSVAWSSLSNPSPLVVSSDPLIDFLNSSNLVGRFLRFLSFVPLIRPPCRRPSTRYVSPSLVAQIPPNYPRKQEEKEDKYMRWLVLSSFPSWSLPIPIPPDVNTLLFSAIRSRPLWARCLITIISILHYRSSSVARKMSRRVSNSV